MWRAFFRGLSAAVVGGLVACGGERVVVEQCVVGTGSEGGLGVRVERTGWIGPGRGVSGRALVAEVDGRVVGCGRTGEDGSAVLELGEVREGVHRVTIRGPGSGGVWKVLIAAWGTPVIVCDVDGTIYLRGGRGLLEGPGTGLEHAWPDAAAVLRRLAERFGVVYLTAREEAFRAETAAFLEAGGFPAGPLVMWDAWRDPISRVGSKTKKLLGLSGDWPWVMWGIGDRWSDVESYEACGVAGIVLDPRADWQRDRARGGRGWVARNWKEVERIVAGEGGTRD
ncbi:MAG: hypothetical protein JXQ29_10100 [Planctomycetes bacterium]|nr:hypothetical protein [Planctomycetota bacterium]